MNAISFLNPAWAVTYALFFILMGCSSSGSKKIRRNSFNKGSYGYDVTSFPDTKLIVLNSRIRKQRTRFNCPEFQGRVMTSSANGEEERVLAGSITPISNPERGMINLILLAGRATMAGPGRRGIFLYFEQGDEQVFTNGGYLKN